MSRLRSLDGLRGFAALSIVIWHWYFLIPDAAVQQGWTAQREPFFSLLRLFYIQGWAAVDLFFSLSGFVFFWLYGETIRNRDISGGAFARLRVSRLYPLQFATLLIVCLQQFVFLRSQGHTFIFGHNDWPHFLAQLFMVQNWLPGSVVSFNGVNWSVSIEILLYVIFFLTCRAGLQRRAHYLCIALVGGSLVTWDEDIARGIIGFFMGGFAFSLWMLWRDDRHAKRIARGLGAAAVAGWGILLFMTYRHAGWFAQGYAHNIFIVLFGFLLSPLTVLALALREYLRGPSHAIFGFLGDISYAVYLLHFPMMLVLALLGIYFGLGTAFLMQGWVLLVFLTALIGLSALVHYRFERPMQLLLRGGLSRARMVSFTGLFARQ
jgi:peptidoglycan/LPS O-acetylase OafA/YrhL